MSQKYAFNTKPQNTPKAKTSEPFDWLSDEHIGRLNKERIQDNEAIDTLNKFIARPHHIGFDNLKKSIRDGVSLMMELQGYETGLSLRHFAHGEESSLALADVLKSDDKKRQKAKEFQEWLEKIQRFFDKEFTKICTYLSSRIESIKQRVEMQIEVLDNTLCAKNTALFSAAGAAGAATLKTAEAKKDRLKTFLSRLNEHDDKLEAADNTEELLEVEAKLEEDVISFERNNFDFEKTKQIGKGIATFFTTLFTAAPNTYTPAEEPVEDLFEYPDDPYYEDPDVEDPYAALEDDTEEDLTPEEDELEMPAA